jgi:hypothetical protein
MMTASNRVNPLGNVVRAEMCHAVLKERGVGRMSDSATLH